MAACAHTRRRAISAPPPRCATRQGTGIVTSVPSDAPDDYAALRELGEALAQHAAATVPSVRACKRRCNSLGCLPALHGSHQAQAAREVWHSGRVGAPLCGAFAPAAEEFNCCAEGDLLLRSLKRCPVLPRQVVPIIDIPGFGTAAAQRVCEDMGIQSQVRSTRWLPGRIQPSPPAGRQHAHTTLPPVQNDSKKLAEAKQLVYLKGAPRPTRWLLKPCRPGVSHAPFSLLQGLRMACSSLASTLAAR